MFIRAVDIKHVRHTLRETQLEFSQRFGRSRFAVQRWEREGAKFASEHTALAWHDADTAARKLMSHKNPAAAEPTQQKEGSTDD